MGATAEEKTGIPHATFLLRMPSARFATLYQCARGNDKQKNAASFLQPLDQAKLLRKNHTEVVVDYLTTLADREVGGNETGSFSKLSLTAVDSPHNAAVLELRVGASAEVPFANGAET